MMLDAKERQKLARVGAMFSSSHDGEVTAAARRFHALLAAKGTSLGAVLDRLGELEALAFKPAKPKPAEPRSVYSRRWQSMARDCLLFPQHFNEREASFLDDMRVRRDEPTQPQWQWLRNLYARLEAKEGANA